MPRTALGVPTLKCKDWLGHWQLPPAEAKRNRAVRSDLNSVQQSRLLNHIQVWTPEPAELATCRLCRASGTMITLSGCLRPDRTLGCSLGHVRLLLETTRPAGGALLLQWCCLTFNDYYGSRRSASQAIAAALSCRPSVNSRAGLMVEGGEFTDGSSGIDLLEDVLELPMAKGAAALWLARCRELAPRLLREALCEGTLVCIAELFLEVLRGSDRVEGGAETSRRNAAHPVLCRTLSRNRSVLERTSHLPERNDSCGRTGMLLRSSHGPRASCIAFSGAPA